MEKKTQNNAEFNPMAEHIAFADNYIANAGNISKTCICLGDAARNIYYHKYKLQEGFEAWLAEYAKQAVLKRSGKWYLILERYAEAGSFKHLERLMEIAKEFLPEPEKHIHLHDDRVFVYRDFTEEEVNDNPTGNLFTTESSSGNRVKEAV